MIDLHGRSGRVALPRTKLVPARPVAREVDFAAARRALRAVEVRSKEVDMLRVGDLLREIRSQCLIDSTNYKGFVVAGGSGASIFRSSD